MSKYKAEVGGFVTVYRQRVVTIYADSMAEAEEKAKQKFVDLQQSGSGSPMCDDGTINEIERID